MESHGKGIEVVSWKQDDNLEIRDRRPFLGVGSKLQDNAMSREQKRRNGQQEHEQSGRIPCRAESSFQVCHLETMGLHCDPKRWSDSHEFLAEKVEYTLATLGNLLWRVVGIVEDFFRRGILDCSLVQRIHPLADFTHDIIGGCDVHPSLFVWHVTTLLACSIECKTKARWALYYTSQ